MEATMAEDQFPEKAETEFETSTISVPIKRDGDVIETLKMKALLKLDRYRPETTAAGRRQFEFLIRQWEVGGQSDALGGYAAYCLSDVPQPRSVCVALQDESDFPALIVYSAIYDIFINGEKVIKSQPGIGVGTGVTEIPPRGITVSFGKPFEMPGLLAMAGDCKDMMALSASEFEASIAELRALRLQ